ncbi:MAG TPA: DUF748 domain-containing protein [Methylomirabilota bacterium]|nr:DUF748 domain-containing protein [Methylomirabilota bacterium]
MPRRWRWAAGLLGVVVLLAYTVAYLTDEPLRRYVEREVNHRLTGYTVRIRGLSLHPHSLSFDLKDSTIAQDANPARPIADIHRLNTSIHWGALLRGRLVADITFDRPTVHLDLGHIRTEARSDVALKDRGWQQALEAVALDMKINRLHVFNGDVTYVDPGPFKPLHLSRLNLTAENIRNIKSRERTYPSDFHVDGVVFDAGRLRVAGQADFLAEPHPGVRARFELERVAMDYFKPVTNRVNLSVSKGTLTVSGDVEYAPTVKTVSLDRVLVDRPEVEYFHTPQTAAAESERATRAVSAAKKVSNDPDVQLRVDRVDIVNARLAYTNRVASPPYRLVLTEANLSVDNLSNQRTEGAASVRLSGQFMGTGRTQALATVRAATGRADINLTLQIEDTELTSMNDLVRAYGGFDAAGGQFSVYTELRVKDGRITGYVKPLIRGVEVAGGQPEQPKGLRQNLYEGAVAVIAMVLKNRSRDEIATVITISGPVDQPQTSIWEVIGGLLENAFFKAIPPGFERAREKARS